MCKKWLYQIELFVLDGNAWNHKLWQIELFGSNIIQLCANKWVLNRLKILSTNSSVAFWLGRLAFVSDGVSNNGRFETERLPTSVGPPSGGRAAFLSPMHPLYSTRPHDLVQAIFWHTCPGLDLGPWYCLTH